MYYKFMQEGDAMTNLQKYGLAPGAKVMMKNEMNHALQAVESGMYITYYNNLKKHECFRVGENSLCFCGHSLKQHRVKRMKNGRYIFFISFTEFLVGCDLNFYT